MDTPVVNGTAYPYIEVEPTVVRFRILSVANDRFYNLSLFVAASKTSPTTAGATGAVLCDGTVAVNPADCTEVKMVPFNSSQTSVKPFPYDPMGPLWYTRIPNGFTFDDRDGGVPDPDTRGPAMIQIGTEGGFLPAPVVIKNQPVNYVYNRRDIVVGNVNEKALFLGPAERADVIVDFSPFAGKTLILYNDSPAPVPGGRSAARLLHRQPGSDRHRRRALDLARLRPQHPDPHADPGQGNRGARATRARLRQSDCPGTLTTALPGRLRRVPGADHRPAGGLQPGLWYDDRRRPRGQLLDHPGHLADVRAHRSSQP